jgi:predicted dehydrogenase
VPGRPVVIRVGVVGCGAMGRRHARAAADHPATRLAWVADRSPERAAALAAELGCGTSPSRVDLAVNATPASEHRRATESFDAAWWLVEKPLAPTLAEAERFGRERVRVGLIERFNPALSGVPAPRTAEIRRVGPAAGRGVDVDVLLDLLVHDLDLCLRWAGPLEVRWARIEGRGADGRIEALSARVGAPGFDATLSVSRQAPARERVAVLDGRTVDLVHATDAVGAQWAALVAEIAGGPTRVATVEEALAGLRLVERIRSRAEGSR